jgi:hypothetical protein
LLFLFETNGRRRFGYDAGAEFLQDDPQQQADRQHADVGRARGDLRRQPVGEDFGERPDRPDIYAFDGTGFITGQP